MQQCNQILWLKMWWHWLTATRMARPLPPSIIRKYQSLKKNYTEYCLRNFFCTWDAHYQMHASDVHIDSLLLAQCTSTWSVAIAVKQSDLQFPSLSVCCWQWPTMAEIRKTFVNSPPLWVSCLQGNTGWVFASLARGENPNRSSPGGVPALMYAVSKGHNDILEVFLRAPFLTEL